MAGKTCPFCGAVLDPARNSCPNCREIVNTKGSLTPYLIGGGIVVIVVLAAAAFLLHPGSGASAPLPPATPLPTIVAASAPEAPRAPSCTIAISGTRIPPATIRLQVMSSSCFAGDVAALRVTVNGVDRGTLDPGPGSSGTFVGSSGSSSVVVVAKYASGAESVVYQNAAL